MSSFAVDQFMQVRCKFQLTSETESSESIHSNNEKVRLCTSVDLDRNSTLIVMICSNETGNNHIVAYYIERRLHTTPISTDASFSSFKLDNEDQRSPNRSQPNLTFSLLAAVANQTQQQHQQSYQQSPCRSGNGFIKRTKPRIIVKQIYYHNYNEDIVALSLSDSGNKLVLVSASSTIYILPIKNILLNLHAKQLRSSQGKSMYFYDAVILDCCHLVNPVAVACFESSESDDKTTVMVADEGGELKFMSLEEKKEISGTHVNERIKSLKVIRDRFGYSLLITCDSFKQYWFVLELYKQSDLQNSDLRSRAETGQNMCSIDEYTTLKIPDIMPSWERKPTPITLHRSSHSQGGGGGGLAAAAAIQRVLAPTSRKNDETGSMFSGDRSPLLVSYHQPNLISVIDVLGIQKPQAASGNRVQAPEARLLRFFSSKQFYYRPQKPTLVCKLTCLEADEIITQTVLTDRFIAIATDRDRCLINSRNCCNPLRHSNSPIELDPIVKEITFNNEERILQLLKSPISNDQDNIIDSFLLVTNRSIYSIEARQSCRDMFINLIDSHLGIKPSSRKKSITGALISSTLNPNEFSFVEVYTAQRKNSESNLIVSSFLSQRDEVYEKINYDSRAFSFLFKIELNSLYEAYADKLLLRNQYELANRFFQMAKFDHTKITGKYIRLGAYRQTIEYVINVVGDENEILDEKERIDLSKDALECLLAKTIVERSKTTLYNSKLKFGKMQKLTEYHEIRTAIDTKNSPFKRYDTSTRRWSQTSVCKIDPYLLCEHSPQCQSAKLSANTIVVDYEDDDESTMTACINDVQNGNTNNRADSTRNKHTRLECEKALLNFIDNYMAPSLYSHVMMQLVDFGLIDLAETIARSHSRIHSLMKILLKAKNENRIIFRDGRFENLVDKLTRKNYNNLVRIDNSEPQLLEFITSPEVIKTLVKDIHLTSDYLGYHQTLMQFRKYSFSTLCQLDSFRKLVLNRRQAVSSTTFAIGRRPEVGAEVEITATHGLFTKHEKQSIENIFIEFMNACLDESNDDSCRLWFNYINFYLNYVGTIEELEQDILNILDSNVSDCRLAITLFKAIDKDESGLQQGKTFKTTEIVANTPLESMKELYNLCDLFKNEFLMKVLEKTLDTQQAIRYE